MSEGPEIEDDYYYVASNEAYYNLDIDPTGSSHLVIFLDSIEGLAPGDEIGVFD